MSRGHLHAYLRDLSETESFGRALAEHLRAGDVVLLQGPLGAGKSALARSVITALLDAPEDIPSPTFTLVQTYETSAFEIWHCDLYRLDGPDGVVALGLEEAFEHAVMLIEWPERLGNHAPKSALQCLISPQTDETRRIELSWSDPSWDGRLKGLPNG